MCKFDFDITLYTFSMRHTRIKVCPQNLADRFFILTSLITHLGCYLFQIKEINKEKYRRTYEDVMKRLDRYENEFLPQVKLDTTEVRLLLFF